MEATNGGPPPALSSAPAAPSDGSPTKSSTHRRTPSGSSLLSKFPFMKPSPSDSEPPLPGHDDDHSATATTATATTTTTTTTTATTTTTTTTTTTPRASSSIIQQQRTRRRRGSLRKVALLGRGAQRDRKDPRYLTIDTAHAAASFALDPATAGLPHGHASGYNPSAAGLTSSPAIDAYGKANGGTNSSASSATTSHPDRDPSGCYASTDEDDILQIPPSSTSLRQSLPLSPRTDYFGSLGAMSTKRRRSVHQAKSPLSYSGLSTSTLPPRETDWDYSDTEWWGWVVLCVTWFVFVIGMGSCFDIWSWAWDVGKTPYAPPELEDDPTLPIVGYYPALIILTGIMAWVWVITAWVGMKYFRHAKISGD